MAATSPSLVRRLTTRLVVITLAGIAGSYCWLYYQLDYATNRIWERSLITEAKEIGSKLKVDSSGVHLALPIDLLRPAIEGNGKLRYAVTDAHGVVRSESRWPPAPLSDVAGAQEPNGLYEIVHDKPVRGTFYGATVPVRAGADMFTVQVERTGDNNEPLMDTLLEEFFKHGAWVAVPFLIVLLTVSFYTVRGTVAPINELSDQSAAIGPASTEMRLSEVGVPREILGLVRAVNQALDRLDAGFRMQREFTADAAHELRTPLAILQAHVDTVVDKETSAALKEDFDRVTRVVADLLRVAQLESISATDGERCDLSELAVEAASFLLPLAEHHGQELHVIGADRPIIVRANKTYALPAVRNLVENAIFHAPKGTTITIRTAGPAVSVIDSGPGVPDDQKDRIFQRFWRARRTGSGSGLGLAIVKRTMEIYGGWVEVTNTPGGGATFTLHFRPESATPTRAPDDVPPPDRRALETVAVSE